MISGLHREVLGRIQALADGAERGQTTDIPRQHGSSVEAPLRPSRSARVGRRKEAGWQACVLV